MGGCTSSEHNTHTHSNWQSTRPSLDPSPPLETCIALRPITFSSSHNTNNMMLGHTAGSDA